MTNVLRVVLFAICAAFMSISANAAPATPQDLALIAAAQRGDLGVVEELFRAGASVQARDGEGRTALLVATEADQIAVARALIGAGADVNAKDNIERGAK
jgi:ankyrin repeat protein